MNSSSPTLPFHAWPDAVSSILEMTEAGSVVLIGRGAKGRTMECIVDDIHHGQSEEGETRAQAILLAYEKWRAVQPNPREQK